MKTVKQMSDLTGISIRTLRYYDEIGLLVPADRSEAGYRLYDEKNLEQLNAILFLRELDAPLDVIKTVVNAENRNYGTILKDYRKKLLQKINKLQGLLQLVDGMGSEVETINFESFQVADAEKVAETIITGADIKDECAVSEIYELVKDNVVDGKVGNELLQIYGSKENYLSAVEESSRHPETMADLQEELKNIYFAFNEVSEDRNELVKRLEENTKRMYRTANARYILLKVAEDYLQKSKNAQVLDRVYGMGVTESIGKAIRVYYGI